MILHPELSIILKTEHPHLIESVLFQSFPDLELLLCDDSQHPSPIYLKYVNRDPRVRIIHASTQSQAAQFSSGRYLCFVSETEAWHPQTLMQFYNRIPDFPLGNIHIAFGQTHLLFIPSARLTTFARNFFLRLRKKLFHLKHKLINT